MRIQNHMKKVLLFLCAVMMPLPIMAEENKQLTEQEAIDLAKQACIESGISAEIVNESLTRYSEDDGKRFIMFNPKRETGPYFGFESFHATIDSDGRARCFGGM